MVPLTGTTTVSAFAAIAKTAASVGGGMAVQLKIDRQRFSLGELISPSLVLTRAVVERLSVLPSSFVAS